MTTKETEKSAKDDAILTIQNLYLKSVAFETTNSPQHYHKQWKPELSIQLDTDNKKLENDIYEVTLTVTSTVKTQNEIAYTGTVKQAGTFKISGVDDKTLDHVLGSFCPNMLYPYIREVVSSEVSRANFPPLVLAPINFDALYLQKQNNKNKNKTNKNSK